jgi:hypothetical protein
MRFAFAGLLAFAMTSALAAERQVWGFVKSGEDARLFYGAPKADEFTIAFLCRPRAKRIEVVSFVLTDAPKMGQAVATTLSNGTDFSTYDGRVAGDDEDGLHFETSVAAERKVTDVLKSGRTLTIRVRGKLKRVPLRGVAKPLAEFEKLCFV